MAAHRVKTVAGFPGAGKPATLVDPVRILSRLEFAAGGVRFFRQLVDGFEELL
jgi:hypothetical protein